MSLLAAVLAAGCLLGHVLADSPAGPAATAARPTTPPARGSVIFETRFDRPESLKPWAGVDGEKVQLVPGREGRTAVRIALPAPRGEAPGGKSDSYGIHLDLPAAALRGCRIRGSAMVKAENVAQPPNSWNGIKCMVHAAAPSGDVWPQQSNLYGTFDWKRIGFVAAIPGDATTVTLTLGLEQAAGTVWFDEVSLVCAAPPRTRPATRPTGPVFRGHDLPRLRGTMISPNMSEDDLRVLASWGANHIRWQLLWNGFPHSPADNGDLKAYDAWLEGALAKLDRFLPLCRELGILVTVDLHTPPGGRDKSLNFPLFAEKRFQDKFIQLWKDIARRYRGNKAVWGYDLVNEPCEGHVGEALCDWQELAERTARAVREIDPDHAIIIEPAPWGSIDGLKDLQPINVPGVVYSVHMYQPHAFTHQGVYGGPVNLVYPGQIGGKLWDKAAIRQTLQSVREWQLDYGTHMYIGEFSAIRWAPGDSACNYLRDVIDVMEEFGWDWAYHAFREWNGWSVEHGGDPKDSRRSPTPTDREKLLRGWFAKNQRPRP